IDAVLMYAQRGSGKRSSYYSDYTFGAWTTENGEEVLVPVGKAYFGFTDEELLQIDRFVRRNTIDRLRWDKPPGEADRLETLERMLESVETAQTGTSATLPKFVNTLRHPPKR